jgi:hypothetical protein
VVQPGAMWSGERGVGDGELPSTTPSFWRLSASRMSGKEATRRVRLTFRCRFSCRQVQLQTEVYFVSDVLRGDDTTEMRVRLVRFMEEEVPVSDE